MSDFLEKLANFMNVYFWKHFLDNFSVFQSMKSRDSVLMKSIIDFILKYFKNKQIEISVNFICISAIL